MGVENLVPNRIRCPDRPARNVSQSRPTAFLFPCNVLILLVAKYCLFHTNLIYQILTTGLVILHHQAYESSGSSNLLLSVCLKEYISTMA